MSVMRLRLRAALAILGLVTVLLGGTGAAPATAAENQTLEQTLIIHADDHIDLTTKLGGVYPDPSFCSPEYTKERVNDDSVTVTATPDKNARTCVLSVTGDTIANYNSWSGATLIHDTDSNEFRFSASQLGSQGTYPYTLTLVFPGKVTQASGNGSISDNTVTWTSTGQLTDVSATGRDSTYGSLILGILVMLVLVAIVTGVLVYMLAIRPKRVAAAGGMPSPRPGPTPLPQPYGPPMGPQGGPRPYAPTQQQPPPGQPAMPAQQPPPAQQAQFAPQAQQAQPYAPAQQQPLTWQAQQAQQARYAPPAQQAQPAGQSQPGQPVQQAQAPQADPAYATTQPVQRSDLARYLQEDQAQWQQSSNASDGGSGGSDDASPRQSRPFNPFETDED